MDYHQHSNATSKSFTGTRFSPKLGLGRPTPAIEDFPPRRLLQSAILHRAGGARRTSSPGSYDVVSGPPDFIHKPASAMTTIGADIETGGATP
jgi:hypothetical protein